jgi:hypothetical protein
METGQMLRFLKRIGRTDIAPSDVSNGYLSGLVLSDREGHKETFMAVGKEKYKRTRGESE